MTDDDLVRYLRGLGYTVDVAQDQNGVSYTVIRDVRVPNKGSLAGRVCDVALPRTNSVPYTVGPSVHTRPPLVPMDTSGPLKTQASQLGSEWQYWSRRFDRAPSPQAIWTHVLTVLTEV